MTGAATRQQWRARFAYRADPHLHAHVRSVIGYQAVYPCGGEGRVRATVAQARHDRREHVAEHGCDTGYIGRVEAVDGGVG